MLKHILTLLVAVPVLAQTPDVGRAEFEGRCSVCHGAAAAGGELGPGILNRLPRFNDADLGKLIRTGIPARGMPASTLTEGQMNALVTFLRTLRAGRRAPVRRTVETTDGRRLDGLVINESFLDLQLRTNDSKVHLLRAAGNKYREVTSQADWPGYHGDARGNRYTTLSQIDKGNVGSLAAKWIFTLENTARLQTTPVIVQGIMYVTSGNECYALDAGTGREVWHFQRPRTKGLIGNAAGGANRGVAWAGERVFMVTDNAHVIALNRMTGELEWETEMADWRQNYNATSAPLVVGNKVVTGTAGGEQGVRGFIAAYDQATGKEAWRFWTVPGPGEPGSETWKGPGIEHGGGASWFTGIYDAETDTVYWPTGNPGPDYNDEKRGGDNLYTCSIVALDGKTGKLEWYYQTTPHDRFDWDATEPLVLVDTTWEGQPRKLLIQANRNGFFYVLDRTNGKLLLAKPFVDKITWAKEVGADGKPVLLPLPAAGRGTQVCPSQDGATNWFSTSYNPGTGLYYVQTLEKCGIYTVAPVEWEAGRAYLGGAQRNVPGEAAQKILRALDIRTGKAVWELPQKGAGNSWGGIISTATGLLFFGDDSGMLVASDASTGKPLWQFQTSQVLKASPVSYEFDGKQYVAIAAGANILAFALP
ncbi:MAG: PQQ-dependent dehydrogenase, methanol/ethanol family [Acidobacteriota bacterium]